MGTVLHRVGELRALGLVGEDLFLFLVFDEFLLLQDRGLLTFCVNPFKTAISSKSRLYDATSLRK